MIKPCCIGDVLMATPTLAALAKRFPDARIDVAVGPWARAALECNPRADRLVDAEDLLGGRTPRPAAFARVAARLRGGRYDAAMVLERSFWLGLLPLAAGIPVRVGLDSGGRGFTHTIGVPVVGVRHEAELYLDCARALGARAGPGRMEFCPPPEAAARARAALEAAGWRGEAYAVIHPGGGANPAMRLLGKRWPPEQFGALARRLAARDVRPVLVWGRGEDQVGRAVLDAAEGTALAVGDTLDLAALGALDAGARLYVGNDAGTTHLALAVGTTTVAIFGPSDERRFGPYGANGEAVAWPSLASDDPAGAFHDRPVEAVSVEFAWAAVERALARVPAADGQLAHEASDDAPRGRS